jgi:RNA polymerase sigma factor (sigma-70 family)
MAAPANRIVIRELRTLFNQGAIGELTDGQLLERFVNHDCEAAELAFAALVERHGQMVLRVCRSVLFNRDDVDDAFQATFLVLVQKARSLWIKDSLGPWLHRVARRIAIRARQSGSRRREHEQRAAAARSSLVIERDCGDDFSQGAATTASKNEAGLSARGVDTLDPVPRPQAVQSQANPQHQQQQQGDDQALPRGASRQQPGSNDRQDQSQQQQPGAIQRKQRSQQQSAPGNLQHLHE